MKHVKKFASFLLVLVMVLSLSVTAFADEKKGSITIKNAVIGQTYNIYKMLDVTISSTDGSYAYEIAKRWNVFFENEAVKSYVEVKNGKVSWNENSEKSAADFAREAMEYVNKNQPTYDGSQTAVSTDVTFTGLDLGYYLVDSSLGSLCSLDTTDPDATILEKNAEPSNNKEVQEDSTGSWGQVNDADIGQMVMFQSTITVQKDGENYVFHDKMSDGLTFKSDSINITWNNEKVDNTEDTKYKVETENLDDECTFHVVFLDDFCNNLKSGNKIVITYSAKLNADAVIAGDGNKNESWLKYGQDSGSETKHSVTRTYTWSFNVLKFGHNDEGSVLEGAKFVLLKDGNPDKDGNEKKIACFEKDKDGNYRFCKWEDYSESSEKKIDDECILISNDQGKINVIGLDASYYYLKEIEAPAGYEALEDEVRFVIDAGGYTSEADGAQTMANFKPITVKVNNNTGSKLPSTGGMGTTIFYVLGTILLVGSAVLLITRRRMKAEK